MKKRYCFILAVIMFLSVVISNFQITVLAVPEPERESEEWEEIKVPDGDFESGDPNASAWNFSGDISGEEYFYKIYKNTYMSDNNTYIYQACSKKGSNVTKAYQVTQTLAVPNGIYKVSVQASGGSESGTHHTILSAGGESVEVTPTEWDKWDTYTTGVFEINNGQITIELNSTVTGQYIEIDNIKLFKFKGAGEKLEVDKVLDQNLELIEGDTFTAPDKVIVKYTNGIEQEEEVIWDEQELQEVVTTEPKTFEIHGKVEVDNKQYDVILTVTVKEKPKWSFRALTDKERNTLVVSLENLRNDTTDVIINVGIYNQSGNEVVNEIKESNIGQGETAAVVITDWKEHLEEVERGNYKFLAKAYDKQTMDLIQDPITQPEIDNAPLVNKKPETFCNPINISYPYQSSKNATGYRMLADAQPVFYKGEYWMFPTGATGYYHSPDLINWQFVYTNKNQSTSNAPGTFVYDGYLYICRYEANIYRSNNPEDPDSWEKVRGTNYPDPYFFLDTDANGKEHLYVLHGCTGLNATNATSEPIVYLLELDLTSPTLEELPVDKTINANAVAGKGYPIIYMNREQYGYEVPGQMNDNYDPSANSWLEGAGMIKYNNKYYVYYSGPATESASYGEGCYVSDSPFGPYKWCDSSPFAYKSTGFTVGAAHGHDIVEQNSGRIWKFGSISISNRHQWERRMNLYPVSFNKYGQPVTDMSISDYPMYVPTSPKSTFETQGPKWNLLSYGMKVSVSSTYDADVTPTNPNPEIEMMPAFHISPEKAVDENIRTWWSASTGKAGEWIVGDMGQEKTVNALQLNFADQDTENVGDARKYTGCYRYLVEYSSDGKNWCPLIDRSNYTVEPYSAQDTSHDYFEFIEPLKMRYIRITNKGNVPANGKFAISDIRLFGNGNRKAPDEVRDFTLKRAENADGRSIQVEWQSVPDAEGYIVRYGTHEDQMNIHHQVIDGTSLRINVLAANEDYYFRIDTYNDSGRTIGSVVKQIKAWSPGEPSEGPDQPGGSQEPGENPDQPGKGEETNEDPDGEEPGDSSGQMEDNPEQSGENLKDNTANKSDGKELESQDDMLNTDRSSEQMAVQTGDDTMVAVWEILMLSGVVLAVFTYKRKRKNDKA